MPAAPVAAVSIVVEPIDYALTAVQCVTSGCSVADVALTVVPGAIGPIAHQVDNVLDLAKAAETASDGVKAVENAQDTIKTAENASDTVSAPYRGGAYGKVKGHPGREAHHMPADSASPIPTSRGPAIQMDKADHRLTSSYGPGKAQDVYRAKVKDLVHGGRMRDAMAMEIRDVRRLFGGRYNGAIREMLDYAKKAGYLNK